MHLAAITHKALCVGTGQQVPVPALKNSYKHSFHVSMRRECYKCNNFHIHTHTHTCCISSVARIRIQHHLLFVLCRDKEFSHRSHACHTYTLPADEAWRIRGVQRAALWLRGRSLCVRSFSTARVLLLWHLNTY
jgi:hypothetical protein